MYLLVILVNLLFTDIDQKTKQEFLQEVNNIRKEGCDCGGTYYKPTHEVVWNNILENTAYKHSVDMEKNNYFAHVAKNGKTPADRLKENKYIYRSFAENIFYAKGYVPSPKEVVLAWKNSPTHCKNLMDDKVVEMGIGIQKGYYTQLFGTRQTN